jgi:hypothetical protein
MPRNQSELAKQFVQRQSEAIRDLKLLPQPGSRVIPVVWGLNASCTATDECLENILNEIGKILLDSGRIFVQGNSVVIEVGEGIEKHLAPLVIGGKIEPGAAALLANVFTCSYATKSSVKSFPPSNVIVSTSLLREPTRKTLPNIKLYANRPVFDEQFRFCGPGWRPEQGILVHGPAVEAQVPNWTPVNLKSPVLERLPPHLRQLLQEFSFESDADRANALGVFLTGGLMTHFIQQLHPMVLLDGNQPGVGKTLMARTIGMVLDGRDPQLINYSTNDEELGKRLLATLRGNSQSCLIVDNAKIRAGQVVSSPVLEANSVAPEVALRILGLSQNYVRPNDLLWFLTMNDTKVSPDIVSRCVPIRFRHEGDPGDRKFSGDPIEYARKHRTAILAELASMVMAWNQQDRPTADRPHRLRHWAGTIGGILEVNGYPEFLTNLQSAVCEFNSELDELSALAEQAIGAKRHCFSARPGEASADQLAKQIQTHGAGPSKWTEIFKRANLMEDRLQAAASVQSKGRLIGNFLSKFKDRSVTIRQGDREYTATLRMAPGRARETLYCFQIAEVAAEGSGTGSSPSQGPTASDAKEGVERAPIPGLRPNVTGKNAGKRPNEAANKPLAKGQDAKKPTMDRRTATPATGNAEQWK